MKTSLLAFGALALALNTSPALAQYIYLDSNGDGVHTSADVLHGVGPTVIDIWIDTGHNRDGTASVCQVSGGTSSTPLNMFSYEVSIQTTGGTVSWSSYTNRVAQMSALIPMRVEDTRFYTGAFAAGLFLAPGRYRLGTLTVSVASGTPRLDFVGQMSWNTPFPTYTEFGSNCEG